MLFGIFVMNEFVFIKSLNGSNVQLAVLFQFTVSVLLFSVLIQELIKRFSKRRILTLTALITRLPLLAMLIFPRSAVEADSSAYCHYVFLGVFLLYYSAQPIVMPIINSFLKNAYSKENFGRLYGYSTTIHKTVTLAATFLFGMLLDTDNFAFTYIYPSAAIAGIFSAILLIFMDDGSEKVHKVRNKLSVSIKNSITTMTDIIKKNKPFRDFEIGFMLYGFAFMATFAVVTIFFDEVLDLSYSGFAFYKNSYNILAILMLPFFGKLMDRIDPRKFGIFTFLSLLIYLLFLGLTEYFPAYTMITVFGNEIKLYYMLIPAFLSHAVFAATMSLLWNVGSTYFCKKDEVAGYQSVHLSLVGARGIIAPLFGVWLYEMVGYSAVFGISVLSLSAGIYVLHQSSKQKVIVDQD